MSARTLRFAIAGTLSLMAASSCVEHAQAQAMITLEQAVKDCRLISEKSARLSCYDRAIDASSAPPARQSMVPAPSAPVASAAPIAPAPSVQLVSPPPAPQAVSSIAPPAPAAPALSATPAVASKAPRTEDGLEVQIAKASINGNQILSVVTSAGETWVQIDSTELAHAPQPGDAMLVTKNAFGKRTCHIDRLAPFTCKLQK